MKFDEILLYLGEFGRYQKWSLLAVGIPGAFTAVQIMSSVFIAAVPDHRCYIPGCDNSTIKTSFDPPWLNNTTPWEQRDGKWSHSQCTYYNKSLRDYNCSDHSHLELYYPKKHKIVHCNKWIYDETIFHSTVVTQFNLVCENAWLAAFLQAATFAGVLVGSFVFGILGDWYGRKPIFYACLMLMWTSSLASTWMPEFYSYTFLRFLTGMSCASFTVGFVLGVELCGPHKRILAGMLGMYCFTFGYCVLAFAGYFIRDWKLLNIAISVLPVLFIGTWWMLPESIRWLISQGRVDEAEAIVKKAAKMNRIEIPSHLFEYIEEEYEVDFAHHKVHLTDLLRSCTLFSRLIIVAYIWFVNSMVYYGVALNTTGLGGDPFLNFLLLGLADLPSYIICQITLERIGRKPVLVIAMILGGAGCMSLAFIPDHIHWLVVTMALVGKFGIAGSFASIYVYSTEIFPTPVRNVGVGGCSMMARVGGIAAPFIVLLGSEHASIPYYVFGGCAILAGLLMITLPETLNHQLPETIEDAENLGKRSDVLVPVPDEAKPLLSSPDTEELSASS